MRVFLTGATGFIGTALSECLVRRGHVVRALVREGSRTSTLQRLGVELVRGDLASTATLAPAIDGCDHVIHLAGLVKALSRAELFRANAEGTRNVALACSRAAKPPVLVYVSSLAAAGPSASGRPRSEDDPPAPVSWYGESKLAGEEAVRALADRLEASIVRPPLVYGPGDKELVPQLVRMARLGVVMRIGAPKRYSIVHVSDLCDAIVAIAERGRRARRTGGDGAYFVEDGSEHTWDEIGLAACAAFGKRARVVAIPEAASLIVAAGSSLVSALTRTPSILSFDKAKEIRQAAWTCTSERAAREVGYAPRIGLAEGMRDAIAWPRDHRKP